MDESCSAHPKLTGRRGETKQTEQRRLYLDNLCVCVTDSDHHQILSLAAFKNKEFFSILFTVINVVVMSCFTCCIQQ